MNKNQKMDTKSKKLEPVTIRPGTAEEQQGLVNKAEWDLNPEYAIVYINGRPTKFKKIEISWPF